MRSNLDYSPGMGNSGPNAVFESKRASSDIEPGTNADIPFWLQAPAICADRNLHGMAMPRYRTEIRSRWTRDNLYFLFSCPFEELNLNPSPNISSETFRLWDWDVAELFIGSDFRKIERYKEFEISPQGEWVDLDIDLSKPNHEDGWKWVSGFRLAAHIDFENRMWFGAMRIPFYALVGRAAEDGDEFRVNFFLNQQKGAKIAWQPPLSSTFHVPERFGILRLTGCEE